MQIKLTIADVRAVSKAVNEAVPESYNLDTSQLDSAEADLATAEVQLEDSEKDIRNVLGIVETVIYVVGAVALAAAIWGMVALILRVRHHILYR